MGKRSWARFLACCIVMVSAVAPTHADASGPNDALYITENLSGRVVSVSTSGESLSALATAVNGPRALVLLGDTLYATVADGVVSIPTSGGAPTMLKQLDEPFGIAAQGNTLYVAESGSGRVLAIPISGGSAVPVLTGLNTPRGVAISGDKLFVAEAGAGRLLSLSTTGGPVTTLASGLIGPAGVATAGSTVYVSEAFAGRVVAIRSVGGPARPVASGLSGPRSLTVVGNTIFIAEYNAGRVVAISTSGGTITTVLTGLNGPAGIAARCACGPPSI